MKLQVNTHLEAENYHDWLYKNLLGNHHDSLLCKQDNNWQQNKNMKFKTSCCLIGCIDA